MKNYNILIVFILISILSGCGGKNYLGEKVVVSTTNLRLIEDNNSFLEQIGQIIESQQEQGEESEEIEKEENAGKDEDSSVDNITGLSDSIRLKQMGIGEVLKECDKVLKDSYSVSEDCQVMEGAFYLEKDGNLLGRYAAKSEFIIFDKVNDKKYQISSARPVTSAEGALPFDAREIPSGRFFHALFLRPAPFLPHQWALKCNPARRSLGLILRIQIYRSR